MNPLLSRRALFRRSYTGTNVVLGLVSLEYVVQGTFAIRHLTIREHFLPATLSTCLNGAIPIWISRHPICDLLNKCYDKTPSFHTPRCPS